MTDWQPIETVPKDGTKIMIWLFDRHDIVRWDWQIECFVTPDELLEIGSKCPTHWMPLPTPPVPSNGDPLFDSRNPNHGRSGGLRSVQPDEGTCDLAMLWKAIIDNTKGNGFWLGEILLATIERETGFNGSAVADRGGAA